MTISIKKTGTSLADYIVIASKRECQKYGIKEESTYMVDTYIEDGFEGAIMVGSTRTNSRLPKDQRVLLLYKIQMGVEQRGPSTLDWTITFTPTGLVSKGTPRTLEPRSYKFYRHRQSDLRDAISSFLKAVIRDGYFRDSREGVRVS